MSFPPRASGGGPGRGSIHDPPPRDNASRYWYVCHTKPRQESLAVRKLAEQGYEVYLPMLARWERKKGAWHKTEQAMFPRYSFVRCVRPGQSIAPIRSTPGVSGLVTFGTMPATLGETAVEAIRAIC